MKRIFSAAMLVVLGLAAQRVMAEADLSEPRSVAKAFLQAALTGDEKALRDSLTFAEAQGPAVETFLKMQLATAAIGKAAEAKFGEEGKKAFGVMSADDFAKRLKTIDDAKLTVAGDTATIEIPADAGHRAQGGTLKLKKIGAQWKLEAAGIYGLDKATDEKDMNARLEAVVRITELTTQIAKEIEEGKFATARAAYEAYWSRFTGSVAGPATAPATQPAK